MRAAGLADATLHTLRHTAFSWMVQRGVPLYVVQKIAGHSTPIMTQRYAHLEPKHLRGAVEAIDAAIRGHGVDTASATIGGATASADDATAVTATLSNASAS
jgi:integrase-like protein